MASREELLAPIGMVPEVDVPDKVGHSEEAVALLYFAVATVPVLEEALAMGAVDDSARVVKEMAAQEVDTSASSLDSGPELEAGTVDFVAAYVRFVRYGPAL